MKKPTQITKPNRRWNLIQKLKWISKQNLRLENNYTKYQQVNETGKIVSIFPFFIGPQIQVNKMEDSKKIRTITGVVYSAKKDQDGKIISVLIDSLDEDQEMYRVSQGKKSDGLLPLINKKVEVQGTISEDVRGDRYISVIDFTLFEEN